MNKYKEQIKQLREYAKERKGELADIALQAANSLEELLIMLGKVENSNIRYGA